MTYKAPLTVDEQIPSTGYSLNPAAGQQSMISKLCIFLCAILLLSSSTIGLQISLRETQPNTSAWHFALVIHNPNVITKEGVELTVYEHVINQETKRLEFQERNGDRPPKIYKKQILATADLHRVNDEANDDVLTTNVVEILKRVPPSEIQRSGFNNCLDFAVEAVHHLSQQGYVTDAEYQHFLDVKTTKGVAVHAKTDQGTLEKVCKRDMAGGCGQRKGTSSSGTSKRRMTRKVK